MGLQSSNPRVGKMAMRHGTKRIWRGAERGFKSRRKSVNCAKMEDIRYGLKSRYVSLTKESLLEFQHHQMTRTNDTQTIPEQSGSLGSCRSGTRQMGVGRKNREMSGSTKRFQGALDLITNRSEGQRVTKNKITSGKLDNISRRK